MIYFLMQKRHFFTTIGRMFFIMLNICFHGCVLLCKLWFGCDMTRLKVFSLVFEDSENLSNVVVISSLAMAKKYRCTWIRLLKFHARGTICNLKIFKSIIFFWVRGISRFGAFLFFPPQTSYYAYIYFCHPGLSFSTAYVALKEWMLNILVMAFINFTLNMLQFH